MKTNYLNKLIKIALDIADWHDEKGADNDKWFGGEMCEDIGLGYRALSGYLRQGVKELIDLQAKYRREQELRKYAQRCEQECRDYLEEVFGDPEPYTINADDKKKIKDFVAKIIAEWDKEDEE